jgi:hypothetical protein
MAKAADKEFKFIAEGAVKSGRGLEPFKRLSIRIDHSMLTAASTSQTFAVGSIPANSIIMGVSTKKSAIVTGGAISAAVLNLGTSGNPDLLVDDLNLFLGTGFARQIPASPGDDTYTLPQVTTDALTIQAVVTTTGANVVAATTGALEATIYYFAPEDPDA